MIEDTKRTEKKIQNRKMSKIVLVVGLLSVFLGTHRILS